MVCIYIALFFSHIHSVHLLAAQFSSMRGNSGFGILPKDTSACRWGRLGIADILVGAFRKWKVEVYCICIYTSSCVRSLLCVIHCIFIVFFVDIVCRGQLCRRRMWTLFWAWLLPVFVLKPASETTEYGGISTALKTPMCMCGPVSTVGFLNTIGIWVCTFLM